MEWKQIKTESKNSKIITFSATPGTQRKSEPEERTNVGLLRIVSEDHIYMWIQNLQNPFYKRRSGPNPNPKRYDQKCD